MRAALALLLTVVCLAPVSLVAKDPPQIRPQPAATYAAKDSHDDVTVAAVPYDTGEKSKAVFGKYDPLKVSVLPLYLVISNNSKDVLRLDKWTVEFMAADRQRAEPIPAGRVSQMLRGRDLPRSLEPKRGPFPRLPDRGSSDADLVAKEFVLQMVPPGDTVGGFLFFDTDRRRNVVQGAKLYLLHVTWGSSGKELIYFEIKLDDALKAGPPKP